MNFIDFFAVRLACENFYNQVFLSHSSLFMNTGTAVFITCTPLQEVALEMKDEENIRKHCLSCGETITGRTDKKFCSDSCRVYFNNRKYREKYLTRSRNVYLVSICANATFLHEEKSYFLLKFLTFLSQLCKIISTFGTLIFKKIKKP